MKTHDGDDAQDDDGAGLTRPLGSWPDSASSVTSEPGTGECEGQGYTRLG